MFPQHKKEKVRFQGAYEQRRDQESLARLYAVRAVSGHRTCRILNPLRFAARPSTALQGAISGLFHLIDADNVPSILAKGLVPGCRANRRPQTGRQDLHFTAFSPFEEYYGNGRG